MNSDLQQRCQGQCEICGSTNNVTSYLVPPKEIDDLQFIVAICEQCRTDVDNDTISDENHWRCLNESIWSEIPAVKVVSYRMLKKIYKDWASDLLNMMYLDEYTQDWADSLSKGTLHKDSLGNILSNGDNVTLIQDLKIKGANFTAKRGTPVRRIRLVPENEAQIEGKIDGQLIVILTKYVKKS
jgi:protein PhnA